MVIDDALSPLWPTKPPPPVDPLLAAVESVIVTGNRFADVLDDVPLAGPQRRAWEALDHALTALQMAAFPLPKDGE